MAKEEKRKKGKRKSRAKPKGSIGKRMAIAVAECLAMVLATCAVVFCLHGGQSLPRVYAAQLPQESGTLVLPETGVFTGGTGKPCVYRVETESGILGRPRYIVRAVGVETQPYDEGRVIVTGITQLDTPYVMLAEGALQDGMEVSLAS